MLTQELAGRNAEMQCRQVCAELERRLRAGEDVRAEEFLAGEPELFRNEDMALELVFAEFVVRGELEQKPAPALWLVRFPQWRNRLQRMFEVHELLSAGAGKDTANDLATLPVHAESGTPTGQSLVIGSYELLEKIAHGGMGVVYKARQMGLDRIVALKMILAGAYAEPEDLVRFRAEAATAAQLHHPNIVQIFEVGERDGAPYFSLEFVAGGNLAKRLDGKPMPAKDAAILAETLARAIHYAHQHGVVHRDLKPSNVLLTADGAPKIADFGLAKRLHAGGDPTRSGRLVGTPSYMAPEQADHRIGAVGPATDLYGLGATFYEMLTGRPPFQGATPLDTLEQMRFTEPVPPSQLQPRLPRDLETICLKCLHKEPGRRYGSALELAEDLHRVLTNQPIHARPTGTLERGWRWCRRNPIIAVLMASLLVALTSGMTGIAWKWQEAEQGRKDANDETVAKEVARAREEAERRRKEVALGDAERSLYLQRIMLAHREWSANNTSAAEALLDACPDARRSWEWHYLKRLCHAELFAFSYPKQPSAVRYSPDGRYLACAGMDGVRIWDVGTRELVTTLQAARKEFTNHIVFSPDGALMATSSFGSGNRITIWQVSTGKALDHFLTDNTVNHLALMNTGQVFALPAPRGGYYMARPNGKLESVAMAGLKDHSVTALSPDGQLVVCAGKNKILKLVDSAGRASPFSLDLNRDDVTSFEFSRDSQLLAVINRDQSIKIWDTNSGRVLLHFFPNLKKMRSLRFSFDKERLAILSDLRRIEIYSARTGQLLSELRGQASDVRDLAIHPNGNHVAASSADGTVKVWDLGQDPQARQTVSPQVWAVGLTLSPDGSYLAYRTKNKSIKVLETNTGAVRHTFVVENEDLPNTLAFSRDSRQLHYAQPAQVTTWTLDTGKQLSQVTEPNAAPPGKLQPMRPKFGLFNPPSRLAVSPNGTRFAAAWGAQTIRMYNAANWQELIQLPTRISTTCPLVFSGDGTKLAIGDGTAVQLWDPATGAKAETFEGHAEPVYGLAFSPNGRQLASASSDGTIRIVDLPTGQLAQTLRGFVARLVQVAFHPDGKRLATGGTDGVIKIWDVGSGQEILSFRGLIPDVRLIAFSADGHRMIAVSSNGAVKVWDGSPISVLCR